MYKYKDTSASSREKLEKSIEKIAELTDGAPGSLDTLKEVSESIESIQKTDRSYRGNLQSANFIYVSDDQLATEESSTIKGRTNALESAIYLDLGVGSLSSNGSFAAAPGGLTFQLDCVTENNPGIMRSSQYSYIMDALNNITAVDLSNYVTFSYLSDTLKNIEVGAVDLSSYASIPYVTEKITDLENYFQTDLDEKADSYSVVTTSSYSYILPYYYYASSNAVYSTTTSSFSWTDENGNTESYQTSNATPYYRIISDTIKGGLKLTAGVYVTDLVSLSLGSGGYNVPVYANAVIEHGEITSIERLNSADGSAFTYSEGTLWVKDPGLTATFNVGSNQEITIEYLYNKLAAANLI